MLPNVYLIFTDCRYRYSTSYFHANIFLYRNGKWDLKACLFLHFLMFSSYPSYKFFKIDWPCWHVTVLFNGSVNYFTNIDYAITFHRGCSIRVESNSVDNVRIEIHVLSYVVYFQRLQGSLWNIWKIKIQVQTQIQVLNFLQVKVGIVSFIIFLFCDFTLSEVIYY